MSGEKLSDNVYNEYPLKSGQSEYIDKIWTFKCKTVNNEKVSFYLLPDYTATLIYIRSGKSESKDRLAVLGPCSVKSTLLTSTEILLVGFRFKPGLLPSAIGLKPAVLKDKLINSSNISVFGNYGSLIKNIYSAKTERSIINYMGKLAAELSQLIKFPDDEIAGSISLMINSGGNIRESVLVEKLKIGKRQFQRKFLESSGLSPKEFCRLIRIHSSTRELATGNTDQYDVLVNAGYYDQSHYYREFKKLIGILPTAFVSRQKKIKYGRLEK
ncbi:MAG: helix-turn-helix domain-containing protein [Ignavibacteria bacterium]|nr:helix-turn-helix domain-containing protein [Ignavibacteria bacterium]